MRARWIVLPRRLMLLALLGRKSDLRGRLAAAAALVVTVTPTDTQCTRTACTSSTGTAIAARDAVATATTTTTAIVLAARDEAAHLLPGDAQLAAHLAAGRVALVAVGALPAVPAESAHGWDGGGTGK